MHSLRINRCNELGHFVHGQKRGGYQPVKCFKAFAGALFHRAPPERWRAMSALVRAEMTNSANRSNLRSASDSSYRAKSVPRRTDKSAVELILSLTKTLGETSDMTAIFVVDCPHCTSANSTFTIQWAGQARQNRWDVCASCGGCNGTVLATLGREGGHAFNLPTITGNLAAQKISAIHHWPRRDAMDAPPHTPAAVAKRFTDGEFNFQNGRWNAAVGMYRAALDLATKALNAEGDTFFTRLGWLRKNDRVTQDIKDWADHVRVEGNGALHDPDEFTQEDAKALRFFTTMFLRYVFEMPGRVGEFRAQQANG